MDIIFNLVKQLSASLSPTEFLMILGIITGATAFLVRFILQNKAKIVSWLTGHKEVDATERALADIQTHLTKLLAASVFQQELAKLDASVKLAIAAQASDIDVLRNKIQDFFMLKNELVHINTRVLEEVNDIKHAIQNHNEGSSNQYRDIVVQLNRSQETISRNLMQIEKMDEFFKGTIPEFRTYHREIGNELNNLSRDIALVERSLQMQINTGHAVKLR